MVRSLPGSMTELLNGVSFTITVVTSPWTLLAIAAAVSLFLRGFLGGLFAAHTACTAAFICDVILPPYLAMVTTSNVSPEIFSTNTGSGTTGRRILFGLETSPWEASGTGVIVVLGLT
ncbi:hypothetical protein B0O80DRAFT_461300 [Mortierella sp. GBAus27b]|nr:hypothetical protein B0O80DRAFT_461300 [Mortierella sp. GBAus27b]